MFVLREIPRGISDVPHDLAFRSPFLKIRLLKSTGLSFEMDENVLLPLRNNRVTRLFT